MDILFIAPLFFNYYKDIISELEKMGYIVTFFPDTHSNSNFVKAVGRVNKNFIKNSTHKFFLSNVLPIIKNIHFSKVLIIGSMAFSYHPDDIKTIRDLNKDAEFIVYQWDSEKNIPYFLNIQQYANRIYTFDKSDSKKNSKHIFLPLFYSSVFESADLGDKSNAVYDCSYIGTAHPKKLAEINLISTDLKDIMPNQFIYHYMPSKFKFFYHKLLAPEYKKAKLGDFEYDKLSRNEIVDIMKKSFCILDAPQAGQTGLTIRTIECLGAKRKLITTNADIKNYDFYDERNVLVYDGKIDVNNPFFTQPYAELSDEIYKKYSLGSWLNTLLN